MTTLVNKFFPCIGVLGPSEIPSEGGGKSATFIFVKYRWLFKTCLAITNYIHKRKHCAQFPFSLCCKVCSKKGVNIPDSDATYKVSESLASTNVI